MAKPTGLFKRNGTYYYRVKVPSDLIDAYSPKKEIRLSLKTKDIREAKKRRDLEALRYGIEFEELRKRNKREPVARADVSEQDLRRIVERWLGLFEQSVMVS